jgi:hypothetical protein
VWRAVSVDFLPYRIRRALAAFRRLPVVRGDERLSQTPRATRACGRRVFAGAIGTGAGVDAAAAIVRPRRNGDPKGGVLPEARFLGSEFPSITNP